MTAYVRDVWSRLPALQASITSIFGAILKIDSTKKVVKKLQGSAANSASWATNIGNERGEVLISVLTQSESIKSLSNTINGLMDHYMKASVDPPILLYTDRDCCSQHGKSKLCVSTFNNVKAFKSTVVLYILYRYYSLGGRDWRSGWIFGTL